MVADQLLPWALDGVELGPRTLEIGPGYGATTQALLERADSLTAVEVDGSMADRLNRLYGDRAQIIHGDGTDTGLPDGHFTSVVCFTMLHHVPSTELQDRLLAEAFRVLQPGCAFAGSDGVPSLSFRLNTSRTPTTQFPQRISQSGCEGPDSPTSTSTPMPLASAGGPPNPLTPKRLSSLGSFRADAAVPWWRSKTPSAKAKLVNRLDTKYSQGRLSPRR